MLVDAIKVQEAENIVPKYLCGVCRTVVKDYRITDFLHFPNGFHFCPNCGAEIKYKTEKGDK